MFILLILEILLLLEFTSHSAVPSSEGFGLRIVSLRTNQAKVKCAMYTEHPLNISTYLLCEL